MRAPVSYFVLKYLTAQFSLGVYCKIKYILYIWRQKSTCVETSKERDVEAGAWHSILTLKSAPKLTNNKDSRMIAHSGTKAGSQHG